MDLLRFKKSLFLCGGFFVAVMVIVFAPVSKARDEATKTNESASSSVATIDPKENTPVSKEDSDEIKYNRDIRPILSDNCFACHGPDKNKREADMRLDIRDEAIKAKAISPGHPSESELVKRILSKDADEVMPPPDSTKKLTKKQRDLLTRWIKSGAEYEVHWAYTPLKRPAVPKVKNPEFVQNPIDAFIVAELEKHKIKPSSQAEKRVLIRRLKLDLLGLPPTVEEVSAFLADESENAYEKLVDQFLASPHFGERMASWWLDVARYADTSGYHGDQNMHNFPYRDYVISAFNSNKPFDKFALEQIAGDLLPDPTPEQLVATGFNRLNMVTREGGAQAKEYLAKYNADRVRTFGTAFLGATLGCCECHDHKFDPFKQSDFYSIAAFFADMKQWGVYYDFDYAPVPDLPGNGDEHPFPPEILVDSSALQQRKAKLEKELQLIGQSLIDKEIHERGLDKTRARWEKYVTEFYNRHPDGWEALKASGFIRDEAEKKESSTADAKQASIEPTADKKPEKTDDEAKKADERKKAEEAKLAAEKVERKARLKAVGQDEFNFLVLNYKETQGRRDKALQARVALKVEPGWVAAIRTEAGSDVNVNGKRFHYRRSPLVGFNAVHRTKSGKSQPVALHFADAKNKQRRYSHGYEVTNIFGYWAPTNENMYDIPTAVWLLDEPILFEEGDELHLTFTGEMNPIRVSVTPLAAIKPTESGSRKFGMALSTPESELTPELKSTKAMMYALNFPGLSELRKKVTKLSDKVRECQDGKAWTMITQAGDPMTIRVFNRGNWQDESAPIALPATPSFLPKKDNTNGRRLNRLDLAKWLASEDNPLTSRTIMNRIWKECFGRALSAQVEDLGAQGETPSHPELLDWLAIEFREGGWNIKEMMKLIVMSNTYRQQSKGRPELKDSDPGNRLLAFQNPRRLDAEFVRDNALSISGLMNSEIGGPSAKPYQPPGYYESIQFPSRDYHADLDERQYRRGLYMHWQRTLLHPMLANFDAPSRDECTAIRVVSNTPQQALDLLNDPSFVEAARAFAEKVLKSSGTITDVARIDMAFQLSLARLPTDSERESLLKFMETQRKEFVEKKSDPQKFLKIGVQVPDAKLDSIELATWTSLCRVILNLHETITRY